MSAGTFDRRRIRKNRLPWSGGPGSAATVKSIRRPRPIRIFSLPSYRDDAEMNFVIRAARWMLVLALAPLILFQIVSFLYPELFLIPIAPDEIEASS